MPDGSANRVQIAVASIPALLAMKGYAITNRLKRKDAYDIYYSIRNYPGGVDALVAATRPLLDSDTARTGYLRISEKFRTLDGSGRPACDDLSTGPTYSESAPQISGSRTPSGRWRPGSRR